MACKTTENKTAKNASLLKFTVKYLLVLMSVIGRKKYTRKFTVNVEPLNLKYEL